MFFHPDDLFEDGICNTFAHSIRITQHALQRFRERTSIPDRFIMEFVAKAITYGRRATDFYSIESAYLRNKERTHYGCKTIVYHDLILVMSFETNSLITVFPVPSWFNEQLPIANADTATEETDNRIHSLFKKLHSYLSAKKGGISI